jgi:hypothetical protein
VSKQGARIFQVGLAAPSHAWVVEAEKGGTIFWLTVEGTATDLLEKAKRFDTRELANAAALEARKMKAWEGFKWYRAERRVSP